MRTFQSLELYDDLTAEENLSATMFSTRGDGRHRAVTAALDLVGITDRADRHAAELSQGERQLVSIARASRPARVSHSSSRHCSTPCAVSPPTMAAWWYSSNSR